MEQSKGTTQVKKENQPNAFREKVLPVLKKIWDGLSTVCSYLFKLRGIILAAPVAAAAVVIGMINLARLPEMVEITKLTFDTQAEDSLFGCLVIGADYISRSGAVFGPMLLTFACLVLMLCSKRTFYPWIISVFTLLLPIVILLTNIYPA